MARRYGRAPRGERVVAAIPHGHWKTTTFIAALRHDRITAPCVFDGPINGASFLAWVQQALVPTLSAGDIVIGDFLLAQGLSRKKRQPTPPSRSALTSRRREPLGATSNLG